jgi:hypothetical protein
MGDSKLIKLISFFVAAVCSLISNISLAEEMPYDLNPNAVSLKEQCLSDANGDYDKDCNECMGKVGYIKVFDRRCNQVRMSERVEIVNNAKNNGCKNENFDCLVFIKTSKYIYKKGFVSGWIKKNYLLLINGSTRVSNNAVIVKQWDGPYELETYIGDAWGYYIFNSDGSYTFEAGGDESSDPVKTGHMYRAGNLIFVEHSLTGPMFFLLANDRRLCWSDGYEMQCSK